MRSEKRGQVMHCALVRQTLAGTLTGFLQKAPSPDKITGAALAGEDASPAEALGLFCAALGSFAGDVALTLGAQAPRDGMARGLTARPPFARLIS